MRASFILLLVFSFQIHAAPIFNGPISSAMGGTGRAGIGSAEGAFINPATIPLIRSYEFIGYYRDGYLDDGQHRQGWFVGAVDNSPGVLFPGSLHYGRTRDTGRAGDPAQGEVWHIAAAYLLSDRLSLGISGYRLIYDIDGQPDTTQWNGSAGVIVLITEDLALSYTISDIAKPGSDVPVGLRQDMEQAIGSFWRIAPAATVRLDIARPDRFNPNHDMIYMAGLESAMNELFAIRLGFRDDQLGDRRFWTAGFGFTGPRLRFDYAFEKNHEDTSGALHSVDLRVPF